MTKKVIAVCAYGPGISSAVADTFAAKGFSIALISRTQEKLDKAAEGLTAKHGVEAAGFAADLSNPLEVQAVLGKVAEKLGPVTVLFWNPIATAWGDILTVSLDRITSDLNAMVISLIAAIQTVVPGMEGLSGGAILVTGGMFAMADHEPEVAAAIPAMGAISPAAGKSAQRNLVFTLATALQPKNVRVGEVVVSGVVSGSEFASMINNPGTVKPEDVAAAFWNIYSNPEAHISATV